MNSKILFYALACLLMIQCKSVDTEAVVTPSVPVFSWDNAIVYFLLTDRFNNGDSTNDFTHPEGAPPAPYRGFMGGDLAGVTAKIKEGYFSDLGVNAIWTTPLLENIQGSVDEGTGRSYGFHGYWTRDWTAFDNRVATADEFQAFVEAAHSNGIRVIMDVIINHTGPVTPTDTQWPDDWVRTGPRCQYTDFESTVECTLVENLPDIKTDSEQEVTLPPFLVEKWKNEGRYEKEIQELDEFFTRTGYPRRPFYYIVKWLVDYVVQYGIDGFRVDTAKHTEPGVWDVLYKEAQYAFNKWKEEHPEQKLDDSEFYMVGEVYNYYINNGRDYDYGNRKVDFFDHGFKALINFDFKSDANKDFEEIFTKYDKKLNGPLAGKSVLNYISSHDDGSPFDLERNRTYESATKLLLTQGGVQIYYGDEVGRPLNVEAEGDARLRSFMDWESMNDEAIRDLHGHWQKLGKFRKNHPAVASGKHKMLSNSPYTFSRTKDEDKVVISIVKSEVPINIPVGGIFENEDILVDRYSDTEVVVSEGNISIKPAKQGVVLLEKK